MHKTWSIRFIVKNDADKIEGCNIYIEKRYNYEKTESVGDLQNQVVALLQ